MMLRKNTSEEGDEEFKKILHQSNFNPCKEVDKNERELHKGYRIDLIYNAPAAQNYALKMK